MEDPADGLLIQRAVHQLTPDVFQHPVWVRFAEAESGPIDMPAERLQAIAKQLLAEQDVREACSMLFLCAAVQASWGDYASALDRIEQALKLAKRYRLYHETLWGYWAAGALCFQAAAYEEAAEYLRQAQYVLNQSNEWVLADLMDLVRQSLVDCSTSGKWPRFSAFSSGQDSINLLFEELLSWGIPAVKRASGTFEGARAATHLPVRGRRSFWRRLLYFVPAALRAQLRDIRAAWLHSVTGPERPEQVSSESSRPAIPVTNQSTGARLPETAGLPTSTGKALSVPMEAGPEQFSGKPITTQLLKVTLLGSFRVELEGTLINNWPSGRSRAVFAYLLAHHAQLVPREVLMETFWPETTIDQARNSLNVAIFNLRHALKNNLETPVILLNDSAYQVNPELALWLDVEEYERHIRAAHQLETAGGVEQAAREYSLAVERYQGDFLADTPYEDWTMLERERLRVVFLETLDRLSIIYFTQGKYGNCISLCQRILSQDTCREDAHCRLMRCYARQGLAHMALRQYQACVEALRSELDVAPSPGTVQLFEKIRQRQIV